LAATIDHVHNLAFAPAQLQVFLVGHNPPWNPCANALAYANTLAHDVKRKMDANGQKGCPANSRRGSLVDRPRQEDAEPGAVLVPGTRLAAHRDRAAVFLDDFFRDPESQPGAGVLLGSKEWLEHPIQVIGRNAGPVVFHDYLGSGLVRG